ncbi:hypothetical protein GOBAR_DD03004 [Gossypium barbadense]|nr:hypothetical protein GOBAR_DD03004 [Gossypium barbadense]
MGAKGLRNWRDQRRKLPIRARVRRITKNKKGGSLFSARVPRLGTPQPSRLPTSRWPEPCEGTFYRRIEARSEVEAMERGNKVKEKSFGPSLNPRPATVSDVWTTSGRRALGGGGVRRGGAARCYYLVDGGYTNCEEFLAPFRGQRYHLNEWRQGYQPSTPQEFFNMKHASARNVIERCFGLLKLRWGILRSPSFYPLIMSGVSESNVSSQASRGTKRKWVPEEDAALVSCMVDLHNVGTFNADTGFKAGYLNELEKMLKKALPNAMLKARPNIESRIRLLKRDWSIVYDMLNGQNNSSFGWDEHRQLVVAEDTSHKEAGQFRHRSFPYYDQLTAIYARDRATSKDAQTAADVIEEINAQDIPITDINEERNEFYDCKVDVSLDDMDVSATELRPDRNQGAATLLVENMRAIGEQISKSIASDVVVQQKSEEFQIIQEKATNLYPTLCEIEGLSVDERYRALSKIPDHPTQMLVFFSLPSDVRLEWVRRFLADH